MDWTSIIVAVAGLLAAVDLSRLLFPRLFRKEKETEIKGKETEIKGKEKENESVEVETLRKAIEILEQQLKSARETINDYEVRNRALSDENGNLKATCTALYDDMCVHKACRVRKPHQGQGRNWYENYRDDPALGADYLSIETLLKRERLKRLERAEEVAQDGNDQ